MLDELRRLLEAATPGPWAVTEDDRDGERWVATAQPHEALDGDRMYIAACSFIPGAGNQHRTNTALIAAAVNALPALLVVVEAARAVEDADAGAEGSEVAYLDRVPDAVDTLRAALAALEVKP